MVVWKRETHSQPAVAFLHRSADSALTQSYIFLTCLVMQIFHSWGLGIQGEYGHILSWRKPLLEHMLGQISHRVCLIQTGYLLAKKAFSPLSRGGSQLPRRKHSVLLQVSYSPEFLGIGTLSLERHPQSYPQRQRPVEQGLFRAVSSRLPSPAKSWSGTGARLQLKSLRAP